jgi:predicted small metal-binding protein
MFLVITCRDLGADCGFTAYGATAEEVLTQFMEHVHADHDTEWYEIEELYQAARSRIREEAA